MTGALSPLESWLLLAGLAAIVLLVLYINRSRL